MATTYDTVVVARWNKILGPADPVQAKQAAPVSLRAKYGTSTVCNICHGSEDPQVCNFLMLVFFAVPPSYPAGDSRLMLVLVGLGSISMEKALVTPWEGAVGRVACAPEPRAEPRLRGTPVPSGR